MSATMASPATGKKMVLSSTRVQSGWWRKRMTRDMANWVLILLVCCASGVDDDTRKEMSGAGGGEGHKVRWNSLPAILKL